MPKKSLADEIADLELSAPKDYDPEDLTEPMNDRALGSADEAEVDDGDKGRDHYVQVSRSSLRKQQEFILDDPRYAGQRASRKDIYSSEEEEQDAFEEMEEDESEEEEEEEEDQENDIEDEKDEEEQQSESDDDDEQDGSDDDEAEGDDSNAEIKQELLRIQQEEKDMIAKMSASAQSDIEKGQHVRQQIILWENFLESRIRIQKAVELANQLPQHNVWPDFLARAEGIEPDLDAAKDALRGAIDDLMELRTGFLEENEAVQLGNRDFNTRKRHLDDDDEYIDALWNDISQVNEVFVPFRDSTLEKWSNKVQAASGMRLNKKFKAFDQNVMTQIRNILSDKESLVKRTQLQRSEYKILGKEEKQETQTVEQDPASKVDWHLARYDAEIFDDNDFYQQLLRELIEARMVDTDDPIAMGMRWAARKATEVKKKKTRVYDRKASKDRKLRFDVHEKLQNFMVPIPAGTWHEEKSDELFSSLLGHKKATLEESAA